MAIEFKLPELGENIASGDVVNVLVQEGQQIQGNQGVIELETEKAVVEIPCPHAGKITKIHAKKGDTVRVGQPIVSIEPEAAPAAKPAPGPSHPTPRFAMTPTLQPAAIPAAALPPSGVIPAGPAARRMARELGVDLARLAGTGLRGRITPEDVQTVAARGPAIAYPVPAAIGAVVPPGEPGTDSWGPIRREKVTQIRRAIAAQMVRSATTTVQLTNFDDADITDLEAIRKTVPPKLLGPNLKLTMMPLVIKAVALALRRHPVLNASLDEENQQIVYKQYVNVGIAVDTPRGLVVPVIRDADRLPIAQLAQALATLAERARAAKFAIADTKGGTFTISNLGAVGGVYSTPIINWPEAAILLLGRSRWLPVVRDGRVEPRTMLPLSLSYDHRLVDGAAAARFLSEVIDYLQSPGKLLLS